MRPLFALVLLLTFFSCSKEEAEEEGALICVEGTVYYSSPTVDGAGWSLVVPGDSPKTYMLPSVPDSIPPNTAVEACIRETNVPYWYVMSPTPSNENYYRIVSIRKR